MKKLLKTRKMLSNFKVKERQADCGTPITDTDYNEVAKELKKFEFKYNFYRTLSIVLFLLVVVMVSF